MIYLDVELWGFTNFFLNLLGEQICSFVKKVLSMVVLKVLYSDNYLDKEKKNLVGWNKRTSDIF